MASPWQTADSAAVCGCAAFEAPARAKAPPPAIAAAPASNASFFPVLSFRLRDMRTSGRGRGAYAAMYEISNGIAQGAAGTVK
ncbi:hypothetical protein GCM10010389_04670 [Streptomyces echinoruber]|uniref:Uncharacterized protein n=1 Tax=Streptomyces echinoruber TaxID=68898 RepID=A0A918QS17_9ACTN|nr:hypothetical protein GCM10010389_04670 [Streptomyces echinoruber]